MNRASARPIPDDEPVMSHTGEVCLGLCAPFVAIVMYSDGERWRAQLYDKTLRRKSIEKDSY
jgi:hypothetical protein